MSGRVAVLGLGTMGGRAAACLVAAGRDVTGFDPGTAAGQAAGAAGVHVRETPEEAVRGADTVLLSLPGPPDVVSTARGPLREARPGAVIVDMSTIDPGTAREAHETLAASDVAYVDAPVLGRPERVGSWTLPAGGGAEPVRRARELLESSVAERVVHVGDVGAGATVKVLNNLMFGAINAVTAEALTLCRLAGVAPETFAATVADSGAATVSPLFREFTAKAIAGDYTPTFSLGLLHKDNRLALDLAHAVGGPAVLAGCVDHLNTVAMNQGWAREDTAAMYELYRLLSGEEER